MGRKMLILLVAASLACAWGGPSFAGEMGYSLKASEMGFKEPAPYESRSGVIFLDAVVARPLGLVTTVVGTGVFVATIPFTVGSGDLGRAGRALVVNPAGWTFVRPLGKSAPQFEDPGVFFMQQPKR